MEIKCDLEKLLAAFERDGACPKGIARAAMAYDVERGTFDLSKVSWRSNADSEWLRRRGLIGNSDESAADELTVGNPLAFGFEPVEPDAASPFYRVWDRAKRSAVIIAAVNLHGRDEYDRNPMASCWEAQFRRYGGRPLFIDAYTNAYREYETHYRGEVFPMTRGEDGLYRIEGVPASEWMLAKYEAEVTDERARG